jgi:ADP-ribose pyrophosphatase YjhB (NUDIX family)
MKFNYISRYLKHKVMKYKYKQIPHGTIEKGKRQLVFVCLYTKHSKPFKNYEYASVELKDKSIPLVLMLLRQDGSLGFPGGGVEKGEDLVTALSREVREEINYRLDVNKLKPLMSFSTLASNFHSFSYEVNSEEDIRKIQQDALYAQHFLSENGGCVLQQVIDYKGKGYPNFLKNNFCSSAKMEFEELIKNLK